MQPRVNLVLESDKNPMKLPDNAFGFRPHRGTLHGITALREIILDGRLGCNPPRPIFVAFLDISKAFDRVCRPILFHRLWCCGVKGRLWRTIRSLFTGFTANVRLNDIHTEDFDIYTGVIQGSRSGPTLFNVFFAPLLRELNEMRGVTMSNGTKISSIAYADDLALIANARGDLLKLVTHCASFVRANEFRFSGAKSKTMVFYPRGSGGGPVYLEGCSLERVKFF